MPTYIFSRTHTTYYTVEAKDVFTARVILENCDDTENFRAESMESRELEFELESVDDN